MKKFSLGLSLLVSMGLGMVGCGDSGDGGTNCPDGQVDCDGECVVAIDCIDCPDGQVPCDGVCIDAIEPTLTSIQPGVFDISCTASVCHDESLPQGELDLSNLAASEASLIDVDSVQVDGKRVAAGDSANSYIMNKLLNQNIPIPFLQMPLGGTLCDAKVDVIRQWIDDGAPVN